MRFLLLNQTFHPDVMATSQYLTEVALGLVERGHEVTVVASRRAYDHPEQRFPKFELWRGVRIHRVGSTGFGKAAKWRRAADFASFNLCCCARLALLPRHDVVMALTSPPLISFIGAWLARLRRSRFVYWVMDFNPDEAIAAGWLRAGSLAARVLDWMSRFSLRRAACIIALDRFMRDRIVAKGIDAAKVRVLPPWSQDEQIRFDAAGRDAFRMKHGLQEKFVVMYSGNHSPCHPLDTLLQAARHFADDPGIAFCFVGGGSEWRKIKESQGTVERCDGVSVGRCAGDRGQKSNAEELKTETPKHRNTGLLCLPYQPFSELAGSLSAADLHVVVMGDPFVGIIHPCKIYNILAVGAPVLYIGPQPSHLSEILPELNSGYSHAAAGHGQVEAVVQAIRRLRAEAGTNTSSRQPPAVLATKFGRAILLPRVIHDLESLV